MCSGWVGSYCSTSDTFRVINVYKIPALFVVVVFIVVVVVVAFIKKGYECK